MVPRFTEFYIPVLQVLSDVEKKEVNALIDAVADFVGLTDDDRKITTRSGNQPRYRSNIQWAITDLAQAGFIERPNRAHYLINIDGLAMLEDNPDKPDHDYLASRSEKFRAFIEKKGTRPRKPNDDADQLPLELEDTSDDDDFDDDEIEISLKELYSSMRTLRKAKISTSEVEAKASELEERLIRERILPLLSQKLAPALADIERGLVLVVDYNPGHEVKVSLSRRKDFSSALDAKEIKADDSGQTPKRKKNSTLKVTMPNGKVLSDGSATEILVYVIEYVGPERVATLGLTCAGMPLVSKQRPPKYSYRELSKGYFLTTNSPTFYKKQYIETIASSLHLNIIAEVID